MGAGGGQTGGGSGGGQTRPALLITIGPQCAGKTTLLQGLAAKSKAARQSQRQREGEADNGGGGGGGGGGKSSVPSVTDVTIDDHPSVRDERCYDIACVRAYNAPKEVAARVFVFWFVLTAVSE